MTERITTPNADRTVQHHALPVDTTGLIFFLRCLLLALSFIVEVLALKATYSFLFP